MKLIGSYPSPYTRKVRIVMAEKRIEAEFVEDNVWSADTKVTEINPLTKVPVLVMDDDITLFDSRVIAEFLDGVTPVSKLIPESGRDRALVKRWEALGDGIADAGIAMFLERKRPPETRGKEWIVRQQGKVETAIAAAARDLGERDYCHGLSLSLGDISLACALLWLEFRMPEITWREQYPNLKAWIEKLETRPSFIDTRPKA
ncbi:MAG: glutathione S-transferase N-terminal domain-containing protein [Betaproteobacteria bacterium]|nr:glutathione S-transferase N-terminal domain-containing protein [Betaproteobacteria bacterium]